MSPFKQPSVTLVVPPSAGSRLLVDAGWPGQSDAHWLGTEDCISLHPCRAYSTGLILCRASTTAGNTVPDGQRDHHPHTCMNTTQNLHMNAQKATERSAHGLSVVHIECYFNSAFRALANFGSLSSALEQQRGSAFSPHAFTPISQSGSEKQHPTGCKLFKSCGGNSNKPRL